MQPVHLIIVSKFTMPIQKSGGVGVLVEDVLNESPKFQALSIHSSEVDGVLSLQDRLEHLPNFNVLKKIIFWTYISIKFMIFLFYNNGKYNSYTSCNIVISIILSVVVPKKLFIWENIDYLKKRKNLNLLRLRFALHRSARLVVSSVDEYNAIKHIFPKYSENIFYRQNWTPDLSNAETQHRISCVGFLEKRKGFDLLIEHMPIYDNLPVHIFGIGSEEQNLRNQIKLTQKNVVLEGFTSAGYFEIEKSAGFIIPSRFEGAPLVLLHAVKVGIPVAVSEEVSDCDLLEKKMGKYFQRLTISNPTKLKCELSAFFELVNTNTDKLKNHWTEKSKCIEHFTDLYNS